MTSTMDRESGYSESSDDHQLYRVSAHIKKAADIRHLLRQQSNEILILS
jgi:hypothetical protein